MLEGIGRVGAYVQQRNLKTAAKYRIKTGQSLIPNKTEKLQSALQKISANQSTKHSDPIRTATIKSKLKGGRKLSSDELSYLRENDPALYRKAKGAQRAREELERDLSSCHTKAEARQALMRAQLKASSEALAELTAAKGGGAGAGVGAGGSASSFSGGMGDDISADINADSADAMAGTDVNAAANVDVDNNMGSAMVNAAPIEASATDGMTNSEASGEAAVVTEDVAQAEATDKRASETVAKEIISSVMREINTIMSELNKADDGDKGGEQLSEDNGADAASMGQAASSKDSAKDAASEIIEKLLYKLRAIQNAWDEFTHSKEYKEMPEGYLDGEDKKARTSAVSKGFTGDGIIDMINQYTSSFDDGLAVGSSSVDISQ
ncbi:MAG: hypothetical protein J6N55_09275 [Anaerovibrio sp.]|uniref:hypothetical protein n=1 Tax=Anaerovibrio sp. TaxID=1872532 RepID=UPI001B15BDF6|nr:hypothetical protein [Anaerovibrio sp.]MBO6246456.1 hypothetical protein [Anaerovibrio sp.]